MISQENLQILADKVKQRQKKMGIEKPVTTEVKTTLASESKATDWLLELQVGEAGGYLNFTIMGLTVKYDIDSDLVNKIKSSNWKQWLGDLFTGIQKQKES